MPLSPGQILNNRYRIVKLLGQGGFGAVHRAWDTNLEAPRAIKENLETSPEAQRQFKNEAQILDKLVHSNLPRVIDHFIIPGQGQYLVMDFVEGQDLQEILDAHRGPLPEAQVLQWIAQVCDALTYLHSQNPPVIHRDIKPANIKITPAGKAMLVDFGIAKLYDANLSTTMGARAVTPGYSPIEQYGRGGRTDARTDVYALGATAYHLLTAQEPIEAPERMQGIPLPALQILNPTISLQVETVIEQAMALLSRDRFQSVSDFKAALVQVSTQPGTMATGNQAGLTASTSLPIKRKGTASDILPTQARHRRFFAIQRSLWWWITLFALLGSLLVLLGVFWGSLLIGQDQSAVLPSVDGTVVVKALSTQTALVLATMNGEQEAETTPTKTFTNTPKPSPTALPLHITDEKSVEMVLVPAGKFLMGSNNEESNETPIHTVYLDEFYIDVYEVTNALFTKFVEITGYRTDAEKYERGSILNPSSQRREEIQGANWMHPRGASSNLDSLADHPVVQMSWNDAVAYCQWRGARLPTEAEWEKAARGTDGRVYPWGHRDVAGNLVNFADTHLSIATTDKAIDDGYKFTAPVGSYLAGVSPYGLYDMSGNVWEWVQDWYSETYYSSKSVWTNPQGPTFGVGRVLRSGGWSDVVYDLRASNRGANSPSISFDVYGFRCARTP